MSNLEEKLARFKQVDLTGAKEVAEELIGHEMPVVKDHLKVLTTEEYQDVANEYEVDKLINYWRKLEKETKYTGFSLKVPASGSDNWNMVLTGENRLRAQFTGMDLKDVLREVCQFILDNRVRTPEMTKPYAMDCPAFRNNG